MKQFTVTVTRDGQRVTITSKTAYDLAAVIRDLRIGDKATIERKR
jgi:hypothetical protein